MRISLEDAMIPSSVEIDGIQRTIREAPLSTKTINFPQVARGERRGMSEAMDFVQMRNARHPHECLPQKQAVAHLQGKRSQGRLSTQSAKTDTMTPPYSLRSGDSPASKLDSSGSARAMMNEWKNNNRHVGRTTYASPSGSNDTHDNVRRLRSGASLATVHNNDVPTSRGSGLDLESRAVEGRGTEYHQYEWRNEDGDAVSNEEEDDEDEDDEDSWSAHGSYPCASFEIDGFSSAEEESWSSDGEIELTAVSTWCANSDSGVDPLLRNTDQSGPSVAAWCSGRNDGLAALTPTSRSSVPGRGLESGKGGQQEKRGHYRTRSLRGSGSVKHSAFSRKRRHLRLSRPLFIEIEDKASEPPIDPPSSSGGRHDNGHGDEARRASEDDSDGDDGALCGCARRCIRQVEAFYSVLSGTVKFTRIGQAPLV